MNTNSNFNVIVGTVKKFYKKECQEKYLPAELKAWPEVGLAFSP